MIITIKSTRMRLRPVSRFALALGVASGLCVPSAAMAETLMDAVEAAYARNPNLIQQRYRQQSVNEDYVQTRGQYGPSLSLTATGSYDYTKRPRRASTDSNTGDLSLNLRQQVYSGGRLRGALAEARANVRASEESLRQVEGEVVRQVIASYAAVLRDRARLEVARENVAVLREQFEERRAKRKVRDVTITDVAQADLRLSAGEGQLATAEAQLHVSEGQYLQVIGHEPGDLAPMPELPGLPTTIDEAFAVADDENAQLKATRHAEEASRANIATQRGGQRPTATITAAAGKVGQLSPFDRHEFTDEVRAQLTITQPLYQSGIVRSRIRQAQADNNADQAAVDIERRQTMQDIVGAWSTLASSRTAVVVGTRQVEAARIAFTGMQREERYGLRSTIEVLNSEQELASAQLNLLANRYQEYISRASLLLAMGRLNARTVNSAIPAKDPDAEFKKVRWRGMLPIEPPLMGIDRIGSASPTSKRKPDLRNQKQAVPTKSTEMPPTPDKTYTQAPLKPIRESQLTPADQLPESVRYYETAPAGDPPPR